MFSVSSDRFLYMRLRNSDIQVKVGGFYYVWPLWDCVYYYFGKFSIICNVIAKEGCEFGSARVSFIYTFKTL